MEYSQGDRVKLDCHPQQISRKYRAGEKETDHMMGGISVSEVPLPDGKASQHTLSPFMISRFPCKMVNIRNVRCGTGSDRSQSGGTHNSEDVVILPSCEAIISGHRAQIKKTIDTFIR